METNWKFYTEADLFWADMLADMRQARASIDIEQYIFALDDVGFRFIEAALDKAAEGVRVRFLCDASGSAGFITSGFSRELEKKGIEVVFYNPISPWRLYNFTSWFWRDHRKITVIDSSIGYTGSAGIKKHMTSWRETHVRIVGPVVEQMKDAFNQMWLAAKTNKKFFRFKKIIYPADEFSFLINSPYQANRFIRKSFMAAIKSAKDFIFLTTPYFVPDLFFFQKLLSAAKRKVDVRLLLPGKSDHKILDVASASYIGLALKAGIRIFRYRPDRFLHAKTGVVDNLWGTVGSTNLDNLSFRYNYEGNIVSSNPEFNNELFKHFLQDLSESREIIAKDWNRRRLLDKIYESFTWPMHNFF
ncbi:MAG: hypothetical protein HY336_00635 [Candidatus Doudnabacteria bacterium]|nr:hypothetical protein [Candidatus Doudnabacteria bacterium]